MSELTVTRRRLMQGAAAAAAASAVGTRLGTSQAAGVSDWIARTPPGFSPMRAPGRVVKVSAAASFADAMQPNQLWPKADLARRMLETAMMDLTGAPNLVEAMRRFVHPADVVALKPNGIAGEHGASMAYNFELLLPVVEAILAVGVPADDITVYEQMPMYLEGCRVNVRDWQLPAGVSTHWHGNRKHRMPDQRIFPGVATRFATVFTEATAVIDKTLIKDHSICGYTGCLKNVTHGTINNPQDHHGHQASPQIAVLYNHPIVTSRVRLHIVDGFKTIFDGGPLDRNPDNRIPHGAVYVSTDPVALDTVGHQVVEEERARRGLPTLAQAGREPRYIRTAADLGLGVHRLDDIHMITRTV